jgi:hypothetical protein
MMAVVALSAVLGLVPGLDAGEDDPSPLLPCPADGKGELFIRQQLGNAAAEKNPPPGKITGEFLRDKDRWLQSCPKHEFVWYAILRASELLSLSGKADLNLVAAARAAVPDSRWIETVWARTLGTVAAARAVSRRWPRHVPAKVVLAAAHERAGDLKAALHVLRPMFDSDVLADVAGGPLLLARVAMGTGDLELAIKAARAEPLGLQEPVEPVAGTTNLAAAFAMDEKARTLAREKTKLPASLRKLVNDSAPPFLPFIHLYLGGYPGENAQPPGKKAEAVLRRHRVWWLHDYPKHDFVWYAILRASELLSPDNKAEPDLLEEAKDVSPPSVWIETVRARALGTVEAAEAALQIDGKHVPAKIALAAAYERKGELKAAMDILKAIPALGEFVGAPLLMARVALAMGDVRLAAETAGKESSDPSHHFEPVSGMDKAKEGKLFAGDAWLRLHQADKALTSYLLAQSLGEQRLLAPDESLLQAMEARFADPDADLKSRERLRGCLGAHKIRSGDVDAGVAMLVKSAVVTDGSAVEILKKGGPEVRKALHKLRGKPRLDARERKIIGLVLEQP